MPIASTGTMSCAAAAIRLRTSLRSSESATARAIAEQASPKPGGVPLASLRPARELASLVQHAERARGARHEEAVATSDQALDVLRVRVRMAARHVVVLADLEDAVDGLGHHRVLVLARVAELLAQVPLTDQHHADSLHLLEDARQVLDRLRVLAL